MCQKFELPLHFVTCWPHSTSSKTGLSANVEQTSSTDCEELERLILHRWYSSPFGKATSRPVGSLQNTPRFGEDYLFQCRSITCHLDNSPFWRCTDRFSQQLLEMFCRVFGAYWTSSKSGAIYEVQERVATIMIWHWVNEEASLLLSDRCSMVYLLELCQSP